MKRIIGAAVVASMFVFGCSAGPTSTSDPGSASPEQSVSPTEGLPPPVHGVQFAMQTTIGAGDETEECQIVRAPPEGLWVNSSETWFTPGSHHVLLLHTTYTEIPTTNLLGETVDTSKAFKCSGGGLGVWKTDQVIGGAQNREDNKLQLPDGIATHVEGNAILFMNVHYLNPSPAAVTAKAQINLNTIDPSTVTTEAGWAFLYDLYINSPARSQRTARFICPVQADIHLVSAQSHMHARGVDYVANELDPSLNVVDTLYTGQAWTDPRTKTYGPDKMIPKGHFIDVKCTYNNPSDQNVIQGFTTHDEMCVFIAAYYPRDPRTELCSASTSGKLSDLEMPIGDGDKSCADQLSCLHNALPWQQDKGASLQKCFTDTCGLKPSEALYQFVGCQTMAPKSPACQSSCADPTAASCQQCVFQACTPQYNACLAATCSP